VRFEGSFKSAAPKDVLYSFLIEPRNLVRIVPDVTESNVIDAKHVFLKAKAGIGPIKGVMEMDITIADKKQDRSARLVGRGRGMQSSVDLVLSVTLEDIPGGCNGAWAANVEVAGMLASIGSRLISGVAERYIRQITDNLNDAVKK